MQEIKRPINKINQDERIRQRLSRIEAPPPVKKKSNSLRNVIIVVAVLVVIGALAGIFILFSKRGGQSVNEKTDWQAVFLTNGEVYFGKIVSQDDQTLVLRNIYYPQDPGLLRQTKMSSKQSDEIQLIKLGNELHGPTDEMRINRDQVLFTQNLKEDSKVVRAIRNYEEKQ